MKKALSSKLKKNCSKWVSNHFRGSKELEMVICWIRSMRSLNVLNSKAVSNETFEQVKLDFSIDLLFDSSFTVLASIELFSFRSVSAWILIHHPPRAAGGWELPPTLRDHLLVDAPKVLNSVEVRGGSVGRCIIVHGAEFVTAQWSVTISAAPLKVCTWLHLLADITDLLGHGGRVPPIHSSTHLQPVLLVNLDEGWHVHVELQPSPLEEQQLLMPG